MRHFIGLGSTILLLTTVAAQCEVTSQPAVIEDKNSQFVRASADELKTAQESANEAGAT
jgi:hypothetical protein